MAMLDGLPVSHLTSPRDGQGILLGDRTRPRFEFGPLTSPWVVRNCAEAHSCTHTTTSCILPGLEL